MDIMCDEAHFVLSERGGGCRLLDEGVEVDFEVGVARGGEGHGVAVGGIEGIEGMGYLPKVGDAVAIGVTDVLGECAVVTQMGRCAIVRKFRPR